VGKREEEDREKEADRQEPHPPSGRRRRCRRRRPVVRLARLGCPGGMASFEGHGSFF
jgi:hypothetical protein